MPYPQPKPPAGGIKTTYPGFIAPTSATRTYSWGQFAQHTATAIGVALTVTAGIYLAVRFTLFDL
jgi:hypothetical protein